MKSLTERKRVTKGFVRIFLSTVIAVLLLASALTVCSKNSDKREAGKGAKTVRVATLDGVYAADILLAKVNGYLQDELKSLGVSVKWDQFSSGILVNEAFAAGEEDIGVGGDVPVLVGKASGQKTIVFAKNSSGPETLVLIVKTGSALTDLRNLKGKKVAFLRGSYGHHFLGLLLNQAGLTFADIEQINLPLTDIGNAVASSQVDIGIVSIGNIVSHLEDSTVKILIDATGIKSCSTYFFANESFAKDNPEILKAYLRALEKSIKFIEDDPWKAAELLQGEINLPVETFTEFLKLYNYSSYISDADIAELKDLEQFNRTEKLSENKVDIDQFVDKSFLASVGITK